MNTFRLRKRKHQHLVEAMVLLMLLSLVPLAFIMGIRETAEDKDFDYKKESSIEIAAFEDNITSEGSFYLGSGSVEGVMKYFYMIEREGGLQTESIPSDNTIIYDKDEKLKKPRIDVYEGTYNKMGSVGKMLNITKTKYKVYVPKGSVKTNYNVDLKN